MLIKELQLTHRHTNSVNIVGFVSLLEYDPAQNKVTVLLDKGSKQITRIEFHSFMVGEHIPVESGLKYIGKYGKLFVFYTTRLYR